MKTIKIAIFGLGVVGSHVVKLLEKSNYHLDHVKFEIIAISASNKAKKRAFNVKKYKWVKDFKELQTLPVKPDILIETIGGTGKYINDLYKYCVDQQISLITANKAQLAENGDLYFNKFDSLNLYLGFEAAVLGAVPVVRTLEQSILPSKVKSIYGIFNGTTNYIISQMYENKISFQESLNQAIKNGFAEQDSSADLSGKDATHKLTLLSNLAFGKKFQFKSIDYKGIENIKLIDLEQGLNLGYKLKLLSLTERHNNKYYSSVSPCFISKNSIIAKTDFEENVITLEGDDFLKTSLVGKGAGGYPTATSILSDLKKYIYRSSSIGTFHHKYSKIANASFLNPADRKRPYYVRLSAENKIGVLKSIAEMFSKNSISIKSIIQLNTTNEKVVPIIIVSEPASVNNINKVVKKLNQSKFIQKQISVIRIEENIG